MRFPRALLPITAAVLGAALLLAESSQSQAPPPSSAFTAAASPKLQTAVTRAVEKLASAINKLGGKPGVSVIDLETGQSLAAIGDHEALNPASNMKLLTAAAALSQLTSTHQYRTALYGKRNGGAIEELTLRGYGDPSLSTADLWEMAAELRRSGVRKIQEATLKQLPEQPIYHRSPEHNRCPGWRRATAAGGAPLRPKCRNWRASLKQDARRSWRAATS